MRRSTIRGAWLLIGPAVLLAVTLLSPGGSSSAEPVAGSAGTDTDLPLTDSAVTVKGRGTFDDLTITVNQTRNLANQAVSVSWKGGTETRQGPGDFGAHYLQMFQCWGDDDGTVASNPGPPPEQCQQGATAGQPGGVFGTTYPNGFSLYRIISKTTLPNGDELKDIGVVDPRTSNIWMPFRAVNGQVIEVQDDPTFNPAVQGGNFWLNPYYDIVKTNEIAAARTGSDGRGSELFQVNTGRESSGLGCGQQVQPVGDGTKKVPKCWLVIVPRGEPEDENEGMGNFEDEADSFGVYSSPLTPAAWKNRIAIPLEFLPVDSPCEIGAEERRIVGSEVAISAIASWQPALCSQGDLPPYSFATIADATARQQISSSVAGGPGMAIVSRPLNAASSSAQSPAVYSPVSLSGITIGFNIERIPKTNAPPEAQALRGVRVGAINLTPRIVAKLLTQSYRSQITVGNQQPPGYEWAAENPVALGGDPDFLRFNPEFELLQASGRLLGGLLLPPGTSDAAQLVWEWIFSDPEAARWLAGEPDEYGMRVNPAYSTDASTNTNGVAFGSPIPNSFPKADPYCYQAPNMGPGGSVTPTPLCGTDWMPNTRGLIDGARSTRMGNDEAKIVSNPFAIVPSDVWKRDVPQAPGSRAIMTLTDTASAARFGLQTARLSRAGDNGAARTFIAPDAAGLTKGAAAMKPKSVATVLEPDFAALVDGAYPLTMITYATVKPLSLDATARSQYAAFLEFATGAGQNPGFDFGDLPAGYVPLPAALRTNASATVALIKDPSSLVPAEPAATTTTAASTTTVVVDASPGVTNAPTGVSSNGSTSTSATGGTSGGTSSARPTSVGSSSSSGSSAGSSSAVTEETTVESAPPTSAEPTENTATVDETTATTTPEADAVPPSTTIAATPTTPGMKLSLNRYLIVLIGVLAIASAYVALEITKRARKATAPPMDDDDLFDDVEEDDVVLELTGVRS
ncbi:MAG: hypothetical protein KDB40_03805 [Acidimicrobiales bacterium]|nr:hypothetical protein [Acidimicrobiales bacterium]